MKPYTTEEVEMYSEDIYLLFPRKEGKAQGLKTLKKILKNEDIYKKLVRATSNYKKKLEAEKTPRKYTLLFSTFINGRWEDYLDIEIEDPEQDDHYQLLKTVGLHLKYETKLNRIKEIWPEFNHFKNFLSDKKAFFSLQRSIEDNYDHFRAFLSSLINKEIGS